MNPDTNPNPRGLDSPMDRDWLDGILDADSRDGRTAYIADDGFTGRVMSALPARLTLPAWRRPAIMVMWAVAIAGISLAVPGVVLDLAREAYKLLGAQPVSLSGMAGALLCAGALSWSAAAYALRSSD